MKNKSGRGRKKGKQRPANWLAVGAMGSLVAYSATGQPAVQPAFAAQSARIPLVNVLGQVTTIHRFDIPEGSMGEAIAAYEKVTNLKIVMARSGLDNLPSQGIRGEYTAERALQLLLAGTGIAYRYTASDTVTLDLETPSTAIDVSTAAPGTAVSSAKYTESLREIPQTIEVIPQSLLQEQGAVTLVDALRNVPGITLQAGEGGGASNTTGDMFNLRGFNASNSIFVDGVRDDGLISRNVFNLEQVEVYLGPTGSDVGRGTASGYVNMQTKTANLRPGYSGTLSYDNADQKRGSIDLNEPVRLGPAGSWLSRAAVRLNALWQEGGVPGRDLVKLKNRAIAPTITLGLGTLTRATYQSEITRQDNLPDYGIPGAAWSPEPLATTTVRALQPVKQTNYYGSLSDFDKVSRDSHTVRLEYDVQDSLTLRYQTRYNRTRRDAIITGLGAFTPATQTLALQRQGNDRRNRIVSNQLNAAARFTTGSLVHALTAGTEYLYEDQFAPVRTGIGTRGPIDIYFPNPKEPLVDYAPGYSGAYSKGWTNTAALYAFNTVDIARKWQLTGGLRWEHFATNFRTVDASIVTTVNQRASDRLVSGKAGLLYRITDRGNAYFSYGTSVTPPGTANFTLSAQANNQNNPNTKPQSSRNYEVGAKWDLLRSRLLVNAAAFHTINENVIFTVDATAVPPIFNQDDRQRVNGFTLGGVGQLTDRLQIIANFGYLDSRLETQNSINNGKRLLLTPRHSGSLWATYRLPRGVQFGAGLRYTDAVFVNAANTIKVPSHQVADALVEYSVNDHLSLRLNVYNVTNETYVRNVNNNGNRYNPGTPRSAMITTAFRF
jgi:catecholate siderophore receptor